MKYEFLTDEWLDAVRALRVELHQEGTPVTPSTAVTVNLVVKEVPFGEGTIEAHVDTTEGQIDIETGHLGSVDMKVSVDYVTAKAILVDGNPQAAIQAFMSGKIQIDGDMSKLMALQAAPPDPGAQEIASRIREMTS